MKAVTADTNRICRSAGHEVRSPPLEDADSVLVYPGGPARPNPFRVYVM